MYTATYEGERQVALINLVDPEEHVDLPIQIFDPVFDLDLASKMDIREGLELADSPANHIPAESPCASCIGACCLKGMILPLTSKGATVMRQKGGALRKLTSEEARGNSTSRTKWLKKRNFYLLETDCAYFDSETKKCGASRDELPAVCSNFESGTKLCGEIEIKQRSRLGRLGLSQAMDLAVGRYLPSS